MNVQNLAFKQLMAYPTLLTKKHNGGYLQLNVVGLSLNLPGFASGREVWNALAASPERPNNKPPVCLQLPAVSRTLKEWDHDTFALVNDPVL